jgi:hypothetical protein
MPHYSRRDIEGSDPKLAVARSALTVAAVLLLGYLATRGESILPAASASTGRHRTYTSNFPLAENPISEGGNWINGQAAGLDWSNVRTTPGLAFGTEPGGARPAPQKYDDSAALLTGAWGPDQAAQATVHASNQNDGVYEEVELRLRSAFSAHKGTGYEILFRSSKTGNAYCEIVRWNGPLGDFTYLARARGSKCGVGNGDVVKATMVGGAITAYINGVQVLHATDNTFTSGSPGIGFYVDRATGVNADFGFANFTAADF